MAVREFSLVAFGRLAGVLLRPRLTFAQIVNEPTWAAPLFFLVVAWFTARIIFIDSGAMEHILRQQLGGQSIPPEVVERAIKSAAKNPALEAVNLGMQFLRYVIGAAILLGAFRAVTKVHFSFKTCFGVFGHALLPASGLGMFFVMAQTLMQDPTQASPLFGTWSLAGILYSREMPFLQMMLGMFSDALNLWSIMLMAVGFSTVNSERIPFKKSLGIVVFFWLVLGAIDVVVHVAR